nr:unnamed protein product [Callosobruchus analis]
MAQIARL